MNPAINRRILFLVFPGFDILDLAGTTSVFNHTTAAGPSAYTLDVVSTEGGMVTSSSGIAIAAQRLDHRSADTMIVLGGAMDVVRNPPGALVEAITGQAQRLRRLASSCTGAFLLGHAGALTGRRATTHWRYAAELQGRFPAARIQPDRIFVKDGDLWTSAGGTAGIDLALALVEEDSGPEVSRHIARGLVVYHKRPGGQAQFSALLDLEPPSDRIRQALAFARDHLGEHLPVSRLAQSVNLSERQFGRAFRAETGTTPAKAVERLRAEAAKPLVEDGRTPLDEIALSVGFSDPEQMRQAFIRTFGQPPQALRRMSRAIATQ